MLQLPPPSPECARFHAVLCFVRPSVSSFVVLANDTTSLQQRFTQHTRTSEFWSERLCHFQGNALLVPVREVGHVHCDRRSRPAHSESCDCAHIRSNSPCDPGLGFSR